MRPSPMLLTAARYARVPLGALAAGRRARVPLIAATVAAALVMGASPASPPDWPVAFISVEDVKSLLDRKQRPVIIDVRTRPEYEALHIAGARSIPLRNMRERAAEVPRSGLVVLY
jgi:hypothetical protein